MADFSRFPTADHLTPWAGVAPGNNESAGKRYSGTTRHGNKALNTSLVQTAHAALGTRKYLLVFSISRPGGATWKETRHCFRFPFNIGFVYNMIQRHELYHELGGDYFDKRRPEASAKHLMRRIEKLGYDASYGQPLTALPTAA